jgi:RNA polymerase sigma factor (sigma-70 family)
MQGNEFLKKMKANDSTVWDDLMPILRRIALGACRDLGVYDTIKEDVVQDVAISVFTHWQSYSGESALTTWMYSIARNRCLDEMRKRKVRGDSFNHKADSADHASATTPAEPSYDAKFELMLCVQQVLAQLETHTPARKDSQRMMDVLIYWVEHSPTTEELAEFLQTSVQAAKQRKYEIRKRIEELCRKFCGHDDCSLHITRSDS